MTKNIEDYLSQGCMRCKFGGTPQCKVMSWIEEIKLLRQIVLETGLKEEMKWGVPVYTLNGKNVVSVNALKNSANISFFKGVLLKDENIILQQQGNLQSDRLIKFTSVNGIKKIENVLKSYIAEAIDIEKSGQTFQYSKNPESIPEELMVSFDKDQNFKEAFYKLTPGRQRGYIIYFSQPKQSKTRLERIEKYKEQILKGVGLYDKYHC